MAKAYFIGGVPRVGKTTLTTKVLAQKPMLAASTDAIRYTIRQIIDPTDEPELFALRDLVESDDKLGLLHEHSEQVLRMQNEESAILWESVLNFVKSNLEDGFDVLVEGVAVLPHLVTKVDFEYAAVFLGNRSPQHATTILKSVKSNPNDWMNKLPNDTIVDFANFFTKYSIYLNNECETHKQHYVEVLDDSFEVSLNNALSALLK